MEMEDLTIEELVANVVEGNMAAFEELYKRTSKQVYYTCMSFLKNDANVNDVMQDTYLTALTHLNQLNDRTHFQAWLNQIAVNKCKNMLSKKQPAYIEDENVANEIREENENFLPESYVLVQEKRELVMKIMEESLSAVQYQTVVLYYFDGLSVKEIAECMNCKEGTVKFRLSAARAKIKAEVQQYEDISGDKLYASATVPLLAAILTAETAGLVVPNLTGTITQALAGVFGGATGATAGNVGGAAAGSSAGNSTAASIAGGVAKKGLGAALKTKLIIGAVVGAAAVGGGVAAAVHHNNKKANTKSEYNSEYDTENNAAYDDTSNDTTADTPDSTDENAELVFDPSVFARSHMTVGGKKTLTEAGDFTYPITNDELDTLTTGYRYVVRGNSDDEEYKTIDEMCEAVDPKCEGDDTHIYSVAGGDARHIYPLNPDIFNYIEVINYSDEDKAPGELINDGYVAYHGYSSTLFDGDDYAYTDDEDKVDYIIEKLGNPDYIIDYDAPEGAAPDDVFEGGHYRMYDMIYDYGTYQICLSVTEGWYNFIDDGKVYSDYDAIDIDYTYYLRNGYLTHLEWDYADYTDDDLTITGVDGNVKFSEFVDMEKNEVVDTTASQETSEVAEDETEGSSQEDVQLGEFIMTIDDYFKITEIGVYIVGTVESSTIYPGDKIVIVGENGETYATQIESMEMLRKDVTEAKTGEYVGIQIGSNVKYENIDYKMSVYRAAD